jgi:hypothetical protein
MQKLNVDLHYNHKMNQYGDIFILKLNGKIYGVSSRLSRPTIENELILSKGVTKLFLMPRGLFPSVNQTILCAQMSVPSRHPPCNKGRVKQSQSVGS